MLALAALTAVSLVLDGHRIAAPQSTLVVAGRALVPIRSLGEALGANVEYRANGRTILVGRGGRIATLTIGARTLSVANTLERLDVAPLVYGGHAYVPIRAAARALDVAVAYDNASRTIALTSPHAVAVVPPETAPRIAARVTQQFPQPDGRIADGYPAITAFVAPQGGATVAPDAIHLSVDGRDVTRLATVIGNEIVYTPHDALSTGNHAVHIDGVDAAGIPFSSDWSFATSYAVQQNASLPYAQGLTGVYVDRVLRNGDRYFDIIAHGSPGGYGYATIDSVSGSYQFFQSGIDRYVSHVTLPLGLDNPFARVYVHFTDATGNVINYTVPDTLRIFTLPFSYGYGGSYSNPYGATPAPIATADSPPVRRTLATPTPLASTSPAPMHTRVPLSHSPATPHPVAPATVAPVQTPRPPVVQTPQPVHTRRPLAIPRPTG